MTTGCILVPQYTINLFFSFIFCIDIVIQHSVINKKNHNYQAPKTKECLEVQQRKNKG